MVQRYFVVSLLIGLDTQALTQYINMFMQYTAIFNAMKK